MTQVAIDAAWYTGDVLSAALLATPGLGQVMSALGCPGEDTAFLVGGAVRNGLLGQAAGDIDLATPLLPKEVVRRVEAAGLRAVLTGLQHGTITAVAEGNGYEVTTFRSDVETDGRRATVSFDADLVSDASRRDFTINALYADARGRVIDPLGGIGDLRARRVRFIGRPEDRIREDYLRILRFFRFHAWYADPAGGIDAEALAASAEEADGIDGLARERIGHEFRRLLSAPDPAPAVAAMQSAGILTRCLPGATAATLAPLVHLEAECAVGADWRTRLSAILPADDPDSAAEALRLSRVERRHLAAIHSARRALSEGTTAGAIAYRHGAEVTWAAILIEASLTGWQDRPPTPSDAARAIQRGAAAKLPITAKDIERIGIAPGPALGHALAAAETAFIESGFTLDKAALLSHLRAEISQND
ncbi:MAG: CCA tRNA nucleotidyltransferase [Pseudomonadota bacterium]